MRYLTLPAAKPVHLLWPAAAGAVVGTALLVSLLNGAHAQTAPNGGFQLAQAMAPQNPAMAPQNPAVAPRSSAAAGATEAKGETVEQRISVLHAALKITPDQDAKWKAVAKAMRENAATMDKLVAEVEKTPSQAMTAVEDLQVYQKFAQAHVDGLKNLIDDFKVLYGAMSAAQKKTADEVFRSSGS